MKFKIVLLLIVLVACKKSKFSSTEIYGHAGNGLNIENSIYHDNSLEAIKFALETEGVKGVEVDVQLSLDGDLWLFHDDVLNNETNGDGCISRMNFDELSQLTYSTVHKEKLIRLKDLPFSSFGTPTFLIDARHYKGCDYSAIDYALFIHELDSIALANPNCQFIVLSKFNDWVTDFQQVGFKVYCEINSKSDFNKLQEIGVNCDGVIVKNANCTKDEVAFYRSNNKKVFIFEVRAPKSIRQAFKKEADAIVTDDIRAALIEK